MNSYHRFVRSTNSGERLPVREDGIYNAIIRIRFFISSYIDYLRVHTIHNHPSPSQVNGLSLVSGMSIQSVRGTAMNSKVSACPYMVRSFPRVQPVAPIKSP